MSRVSYLSQALFLIVAALSGLVSAQTAATDQLLTKARSLESRGRADLAAQTWQQILMVNPNHPEAIAGLARQAQGSGRTAEAKVLLDRLRRINPNDQAIAQIEAIKPMPAPQKAKLEEADRLAKGQKYEQALRIYREVFGDTPPPGGWSLAYYETMAAVPNGWEGAVRGLQALLEKAPEDPEYRLVLGRLWTYRPQTRAAGMNLLEGLRGGASYEGKARQAWRQALLWEGPNRTSLPSLRAYLSRYPDAELQKLSESVPAVENPKNAAQGKQEQQGYEALNAGNLAEAESHFKGVLKEAPQNATALAGLGFVRMKQGDFAAAVQQFEAAKSAAPADNKQVTEALETARFWQVMRAGSDALAANHAEEAKTHFQQALTLRPASADAQIAVAGALMQMGNFTEAVATYERITKAQPNQADAWRHLVDAKLQSAGGAAALTASRQIPPAVAAKLGKNVEYLASLAAAYTETGRTEDAAAALKSITGLLGDKADLSPAAQLQLAGVYLKVGRAPEALDLYQRVTATAPENVIAWEGLMAALVQNHQEKEAFAAMQRMPKETYAAALKRPGFLQSAALAHAKYGNLATAEALLDKVLKQESPTGPQVSTQLLVANVWLEQGQADKAGELLRQLLRTHPENPDVWKAYIGVLHQRKRDVEALAVARQIRSPLRAQLENDTEFIGLLAAVCNDAGDYKEALRLVRAMVARLDAEKKQVPVDLSIQLAWLMLDAGEDERALYSVLNGVGEQADLTPEQRQRTAEIWSVWTRRRSEAARNAGDLDRSVAILDAAARLLPTDLPLRSALAGALVEAGQNRRALEIYKRWRLAGATATDYSAAIGSAMSERDAIATVWLQAGLQKWPTDAQLLSLAGQQAAARGDKKKAEMYWKVALASLNQQEKRGESPRDAGRAQTVMARDSQVVDDPKRALSRLLVGDEEPVQPVRGRPAALPERSLDRSLIQFRGDRPERPREALPIDRMTEVAFTENNQHEAPVRGADRLALPAIAEPLQEEPVRVMPGTPARQPAGLIPDTTSRGARRPAAVPPIALPSSNDPGMLGAARTPSRQPAATGVPVEVARAYDALRGDSYAMIEPQPKASEREELERKLASLDARNTPYVGTGGTFQTRNGQKGFESRNLQEAEMTASATLFDRIRFTAIARPTYISTGASDGGSTLRFGLSPQGTAFGAQSASGLGAEGQISTETFGVRFGATPQGFLVKNYTGGLRFRPGNGPFTVLVTRDALRDTMLSFAGSRDPVSKQVWGGVVANTFSLLGNWGDEKSGFYASAGYQTLHGTQVATNTRADGNIGSYWRLLSRPEGSLTAGVNATAMHYEKNLRFFTLGHGGYFSPQKYVLLNVPVRWTGTYKRKFVYAVNASLGSQYVQEDAAPYFPTLAAIQGRSGPMYAAQTQTGINFNFDLTGMYEVSPGWYLGFSGNANNARYYTSSGASIFLRRVFTGDTKAGASRLGMPTIPDWRGTQPFMAQ